MDIMVLRTPWINHSIVIFYKYRGALHLTDQSFYRYFLQVLRCSAPCGSIILSLFSKSIVVLCTLKLQRDLF